MSKIKFEKGNKRMEIEEIPHDDGKNVGLNVDYFDGLDELAHSIWFETQADVLAFIRFMSKYLESKNEKVENSTGLEKSEILRQYLEYHTPAGRGDTCVIKTSEDIISELSEIVELKIDEVASSLLADGFSLTCKEGRFGWAIKI